MYIIQKKDILKELGKESGFTYFNILPKDVQNTRSVLFQLFLKGLSDYLRYV